MKKKLNVKDSMRKDVQRKDGCENMTPNQMCVMCLREGAPWDTKTYTMCRYAECRYKFSLDV